MTDQATEDQSAQDQIAARIAQAGERAKAEADARRDTEAKAELPRENGGPKGPEPTRFGDWERKGIAVDF
jgi:hypothetical protein